MSAGAAVRVAGHRPYSVRPRACEGCGVVRQSQRRLCRTCWAAARFGPSTPTRESQRARGYEAAYRARKRLGIPGRRPVMERFWERVDKNGPVPQRRPDLGPCWVWTGYLHPSGYGRIYADGRAQPAHRFAYERLVGSIPDGLEPDHLCLNKACVNPHHQEPVTHLVNCQRALPGRRTKVAT